MIYSARMTRHILCSLLTCLPLLSAVPAQSRDEPQDTAARESRAGTLLLQHGNFRDAKAHFERAQTLLGKPTAETSAGIGLAELQMGHFEAARQMFFVELQFLTNDHARAQAHYMIGSAWLREAGDLVSDKGKLQAAETLWNRPDQ